MNIEKYSFNIILIFFFTVFSFCSILSAQKTTLVTIESPKINSTRNPEQTISGKVETQFIKTLTLTVEPFIYSPEYSKKEIKVSVINGIFQENIELFPGLNLIKTSIGGKQQTTKVIFLISPQKEKKELPLGDNSDIEFISPKELKVNNPKVKIKGVVIKPDIKSIDAIIMNTMDFLSTEEQVTQKQDKIEYKTAEVKNRQFEFDVTLSEGPNVIIARPDMKPVTPEKTQIMTLIYEKTSDIIFLEEPEIEKNNLVIKGKVKSKEIKNVRINITAVVQNELKPEQIYPDNLLDKTISVEKDGSFYLKTSLKSKKFISIKYSPTITVFADNVSVSKTLLKWQ